MELLQPGMKVFDRFEVVEWRSAGGQSFGFQATDLSAPAHRPWEKRVFLKQYHDLVPGSDEAQSIEATFETLRRRLGERDHFLCLPLHVGEAADSIIAVYPWIEGGTLKDRMSRGLSQAECVRLTFALTNAVKWLHVRGVAHLDLKPNNIVVQTARDEQIYMRLIDLDAAQIDGIGLRKAIKGTDYYMSPEHYFPERFGEVSRASDVFTLGIMLFQLMFKCHPFTGLNYPEAIAAEAFSIPENPLRQDVVEVIRCTLAADPWRRPMARDILAVLNQSFDSDLEAVYPFERWRPTYATIALRMQGMGDRAGFRRSYYETVELTSIELRGARVPVRQGSVCRFVLDSRGWRMHSLCESGTLSFGKQRLGKGDVVRVDTAERLWIGDAEFLLDPVEYVPG